MIGCSSIYVVLAAVFVFLHTRIDFDMGNIIPLELQEDQ